MHIDKHQLSAAHNPVSTPITPEEPGFSLPNVSTPKPETEPGTPSAYPWRRGHPLHDPQQHTATPAQGPGY